MGHTDDRSLILLQVLLQPVDALGIQMVGRLVEQKHVGFLQQQAAQSHAAALAATQFTALLVSGRTTQSVHGAFQSTVQIPCIAGVDDILQLALTDKELVHFVLVFVILGETKLLVYLLILSECVDNRLYAFLHDLNHRLVVVELRILGQIAHAVAGREHHLTLILLIQSGDDFHQRTFSSSVQSDDAYLGAIEETEVDVLQHLLPCLLDGLAHANHREDNLLVVNCCHNMLCSFFRIFRF